MQHSKEEYKNMRFLNSMTVAEKAAYRRQQERIKKQQERNIELERNNMIFVDK